jgi:hypothetical protein
VIFEPPGKKHLFLYISSTNIDTLVPSLYQCVETRSVEVFWTVVSATSATPFQPLRHQRNICHPVVNPITRQTLPAVNKEMFLYEHPLRWVLYPEKTHNRTQLFGSTLPKHGRQFDNWNQRLNMRMRVCYVDWHEGGLCCYLVIQIENPLRPAVLFPSVAYCWLSLVQPTHRLIS